MKTQRYFFLYLTILKRKKMCNDAVDLNPWSLYHVPDYLKTQTVSENVVQREPYFLQREPSLSLIGLSLGKNYKYGTMTLIIALMMRLLSGLKVRKPKG